MKLLLYFSVIMLLTSFNSPDNPEQKGFDKETCTFNGKKLYGKIKIVDSFEDVKVKVVNSLEDIEVNITNSLADECGEWIIVDSHEDIRVKYVDSLEDIKIKFINY